MEFALRPAEVHVQLSSIYNEIAKKQQPWMPKTILILQALLIIHKVLMLQSVPGLLYKLVDSPPKAQSIDDLVRYVRSTAVIPAKHTWGEIRNQIQNPSFLTLANGPDLYDLSAELVLREALYALGIENYFPWDILDRKTDEAQGKRLEFVTWRLRVRFKIFLRSPLTIFDRSGKIEFGNLLDDDWDESHAFSKTFLDLYVHKWTAGRLYGLVVEFPNSPLDEHANKIFQYIWPSMQGFKREEWYMKHYIEPLGYSERAYHFIEGGVEQLKKRVDAGLKVDWVWEGGWTLIHCAVNNDDMGCLEFLLDQNGPLNHASKGGQTPLHWAAFFGNERAVQLLLENGANVDAIDCHGRNPLMWAVSMTAIDDQEANASCLQQLLGKGSDIELCDGRGRTVLHYAAGTQCSERECALEFLLRNGAKYLINNLIDKEDKDQLTPLRYVPGSNHEMEHRKLLTDWSTAVQAKNSGVRVQEI